MALPWLSGLVIGLLYKSENVERRLSSHLRKSYLDAYKIHLGYELPPIGPPTPRNSLLVLVSKIT